MLICIPIFLSGLGQIKNNKMNYGWNSIYRHFILRLLKVVHINSWYIFIVSKRRVQKEVNTFYFSLGPLLLFTLHILLVFIYYKYRFGVYFQLIYIKLLCLIFLQHKQYCLFIQYVQYWYESFCWSASYNFLWRTGFLLQSFGCAKQA